MKNTSKQTGLTMTELLVTMATAVVLFALAVPAAKRITETLQQAAGARALIDGALASARVLAIREGKYAGLRFQETADNRVVLIFMVNDPDKSGWVNGFIPVDGRKPVLLPAGVVLDNNPGQRAFWNVVFHSSGRLVVHPVRFKSNSALSASFQINDDTADTDSVLQFDLWGIPQQGQKSTFLINPYTGQLVGSLE